MRATLLVMALAFIGCRDGDLSYGPWQDSPVPGGTMLGAYCDEMAASACKGAESCGETVSACLDQFKVECCIGTATCARTAPANVAAELAARCAPAFAALTCAEHKARVAPPDCFAGR